MPPITTASSKKRRSPFDTSVTPQRKHRKLLKDGSGTEVWPESVEKIFVQGLKDYWKSTWATYTRGRSRWRNQFLVEYLRERGIHRTKKQVASHMQVLRNMWKGEEEFHLVAGGEELFLETGLLSPTIKDEENRLNDKSLISLDDGSLSPSSQGFSPASDFRPESSASPPRLTESYLTIPSSLGRPSPQPLSAVDNTLPPYAHSPSLSISSFGFDYQTPLHLESIDTTSLYPGYAHSCLYPTTQSVYSSSPDPSPIEPLHPTPFASSRIPTFAPTIPTRTFSNPISNIGSPFNRVTNLSLWAEGMTPANIALDSLRVSNGLKQFAPLALKFSLAVPMRDDVRFSDTLYGFHGTLSVNAPWCASATCVTQVYSGSTLFSEEVGQLQLVSSDSSPASGSPSVSASRASFQPVNAFLPLSSLSSCRWLESDQQTSITQEITVDGEILLFVTYNIQRIALGSLDAVPSATLTGLDKYRPRAVDDTTSSSNWISNSAPVAAGPQSSATSGVLSPAVPRSVLPSYSTTAGVYGPSPLHISHRSTDQLPLSHFQCRPPGAAVMNAAMLL